MTTSADNGIKDLPAGTCHGLASGRPYVTARSASELLGVPYLDVIHDIKDGMSGALPALIGAESNGVWYVAAFEVEGERLEMHRARLTQSVEASGCIGSGP